MPSNILTRRKVGGYIWKQQLNSAIALAQTNFEESRRRLETGGTDADRLARDASLLVLLHELNNYKGGE